MISPHKDILKASDHWHLERHTIFICYQNLRSAVNSIRFVSYDLSGQIFIHILGLGGVGRNVKEQVTEN